MAQETQSIDLGRKIRRNHNCNVNLSTLRLSVHVHKRKALNNVPFDGIPSATIDKQSPAHVAKNDFFFLELKIALSNPLLHPECCFASA